MPLFLTEELARGFLGALLSVCRADGEVNGDELDALRAAAGELAGRAGGVGSEALLFSQVPPRSFAELVARSSHAPFRGGAASAPDQIGLAFVRAALVVAKADGGSNTQEIHMIRAFAHALGALKNNIEELDAMLDE